MKMNILKASAIALIAAAPGAAMADSIAASLSASFGHGGFVSGGVGGAGGAGAAFGATSVSVAGAAGDWAAAGSVANRNSSAAVAGASNSIAAVPAIRVEAGRRGIYETSVVFEAPATDARIADLQGQIDGLVEQVGTICTGLLASIEIPDLVTDITPVSTAGVWVYTGANFNLQNLLNSDNWAQTDVVTSVTPVTSSVTVEDGVVTLACEV